MTRYKITIEYDGGPFVGWQRQKSGLGVQEVLEDGVFAFSGERSALHVAGRTDAGVHALAQVAHFDLDRDWETDTIRDALNFHVKPHPVSVLSAEAVDEDFHSRFSAVERTYLYRIINRRAPPAVERGRSWWVPVPLDADAMHAAARVLLGHHDFSTFRAAECQAKSPVKTLDQLDIRRDGDTISATVQARSFLHHQVRNMIGTLKLVGEGKWDAGDVERALAACERSAGGQTAPPDGLYLIAVGY